MTLKYRIITVSLLLSLLLGFGGYAIKNAYVTMIGIAFLAFSISCWVFADKKDPNPVGIILDGILFGII
ncbi:MAG: hypothetical protein JWO41_765 [Candidatus Saccharibacteria bacterium]|nr:hypothetical protein [Candidatus Saccharibacteria bacterium]